MKSSWPLGLIMILGTVLFLPQPGMADLYKREGGRAYHINQNCPTLQGYKVTVVASKEGLIPCRVCDAQEFNKLQNAQTNVGKMNTSAAPPKTLQEMSGTAYEQPEQKEVPAQNAKVKYPPNWENTNNRLQSDGKGNFYVNNGQKVYINNRAHNAGGTSAVGSP
ncbi:MAG: hypothetical protein Q4F00_10710 [bacterium]|nr:hypothetical protein [bacterium]